MEFKKVFTPEQANKRLPLVKRIVRDILDKGRELKQISDNPQNAAKDEAQMKELQKNIVLHMKELEDLGCFYKDWNFEIGLVDFPAVINDKSVFLCWRSDEPDIRWYHGVDEGYNGRQPIPEELLVTP
jgi:hypothetical protein